MIGVLIVVALAYSRSSAQTKTSDAFTVDSAAIYYPGQPDTGRLRAEVWRYATRGLPCVDLGVNWTGAIVCDSFVVDSTLSDLLTATTAIDNESKHLSLSCCLSNENTLEYPARYTYGYLYFTVLDTGVVSFAPSQPPKYYGVAGAGLWWGKWHRSYGYYVSNPGDINNDGVPSTLEDAEYLIELIFGGLSWDRYPFADVNGDCIVNLSDATYLIHYVFEAGPPPKPGCDF